MKSYPQKTETKLYLGFTSTPVLNKFSGISFQKLFANQTQGEGGEVLDKTGVSSAKTERGFTLPEILVSVAIMAFIATTVIYNQGDFNDRIALGSSVADVELQIREAQVYGISVREFRPGTSEFDSSYGINFNLSGSGSNNSFLFFADRGTKNKIYDGTNACLTGGTNECIRNYSLTRNNIISDICVILSAGGTQCYSGGFISRFDTVFIRPSPSANITFFNTSGSQVSFPNHEGAKIVIRSPKGTTKEVIIYTSGQISIQ